MTTEREMLEFAAMACGITKDDSAYNGGGSNNTGFDIMGNLVTDWHNGESWNPLTNPADTAEMCAELGICTDWGDIAVLCFNRNEGREEYFTNHDNSRLKAWMYAATMVAAKIGGMK